MDFDKVGIQVLFVAMTSTSQLTMFYNHYYTVCNDFTVAEENRDLLARSGFFQKCSKRWLFPSMQDAVAHAKHGLPLVSIIMSSMYMHVHVCNHSTWN